MSEATLLEKLVKMGLPLDAAYTEGQFQYVIDAALRRAKAEVLRELTQSLTYTRFNSYEQGMCERGCGLTKEGKIGASIGLAWALGEIDARAAQIENEAIK